MKRKLMTILASFIFIFSFSGCSCNKDVEIYTRMSAQLPKIKGYFSKDINGGSADFPPFEADISLNYYKQADYDTAYEYFKNEFFHGHQLFDRHYYYFDDNGNLINNLRVINESNGEEIVVEQDLINILKEGIRFTKLSKGKFNIAVGNLSDLWDSFIEMGYISAYLDLNLITKYNYTNGVYSEDVNGTYVRYSNEYSGIDMYIDISEMKERFIKDGKTETYVENNEGNYVLVNNIAPTSEQITQAKNCIPSYENIEQIVVINEENKTVKINHLQGCNTQVTLTLGALGKSYITQKISQDERIKNGNFLINAGGSTIKLIGENLAKSSRNYIIGISDSYLIYRYGNYIETNSYSMTINNETSISTSSGDINHYYYYDNYYHHIIDPYSGYPNQNRFAVTALCDNAMYADIATTSLMSMNMDESKEYLKTLKENGINIEVFIQDKGEETVNLYSTKNLQIEINYEGYSEYLKNIVIEELKYDA